jgi:hypothetical protein
VGEYGHSRTFVAARALESEGAFTVVEIGSECGRELVRVPDDCYPTNSSCGRKTDKLTSHLSLSSVRWMNSAHIPATSGISFRFLPLNFQHS